MSIQRSASFSGSALLEVVDFKQFPLRWSISLFFFFFFKWTQTSYYIYGAIFFEHYLAALYDWVDKKIENTNCIFSVSLKGGQLLEPKTCKEHLSMQRSWNNNHNNEKLSSLNFIPLPSVSSPDFILYFSSALSHFHFPFKYLAHDFAYLNGRTHFSFACHEMLKKHVSCELLTVKC